jgi:hypothetical protein
MLAGVVIGYVPLQFAFELMLVGGSYTFVGATWAVGVFQTGAFALYRPEFSTMLGVVGVALSILSLLGALGGLLFGMVFGIVGDNLCAAWQQGGPPRRGRRQPAGPDGRRVAAWRRRDDIDTDRGLRVDRRRRRGGRHALPARSVRVARSSPTGRVRLDAPGGGPDSARRGRGHGNAGSPLGVSGGSHRPARCRQRNADARRDGSRRGPLAAADRATYTVDVGEIRLGDGGRICAERVDSDTYRVLVTDARLVAVAADQQRGGDAVSAAWPALAVDELVMHTTGENAGVERLAATAGCTGSDQTSRTVFRTYRQTGSALRGSEGVTVLNLRAADGEVPEPGGFGFVGPGDRDGAGDAPRIADRGERVRNATDGLEAPNGTVGDAVAEPAPADGNATGVVDNTGVATDVERSIADATDGAGGDPAGNGTDEFVDATGAPDRPAGHPARNGSESGPGHAAASDDVARVDAVDGQAGGSGSDSRIGAKG